MFDATRAEFSDSARQAPRTRPVLRIFISSTALDLTGYRDKVRDSVLRLENLPIAMETFSALGGPPALECMRMAAQADAVICIVAHRYGYVPPVALGGDGERSITWLEVDAAKRAGKPVFAFLVDPKASWIEVKEQDRLVSEPEKAAEIFTAVQKLQEFKAYLERGFRQTFTNAEELARLASITLANFTARATGTARVWQPLFCHALQPAQHFRGRAPKVQELKDWLQSPATPDRVISVVAAGGTGKTALVNKALHEATLSDRAGVLVWSFYEDPHTDAFLRAAYTYFTGETDSPAGGMLERLQLALSGDAPHVMVLDGLERVQSEGDRGRRGELEDLQLKRLVRALAGGVGNARALLTSRFPLVDLEGWTGAGHRAIALDDLELPVAADVLRAWGVRGDDAALAPAIEPLNIGGFYHALSVAVLGSYLGNFADGDPHRAPDFSLRHTGESDDPKARKLHRILEQYATALTPAERDLLARLSLFPRGVKVELLGWIAQSGSDVAGALTGLAEHDMVRLLERLRALGLVFGYKAGQRVVYSAHPFLREFFRDLLGTRPESVHESLRSRLAPSLEKRPSGAPWDTALLDQYELLIEETLLAGRVEEAVDLYWDGLGGYGRLGAVLGDNVRGLRIAQSFVPRDDFSSIEPRLSRRGRGEIITALGLFARGLGDLAKARAALEQSLLLYAGASKFHNASIVAQNLAEVELLAGRFRQAFDHSANALALAAKAEAETKHALVCQAASRFALGEVSAALDDFQRATDLEGEALYSLQGIREAECKLLMDDWTGALGQTQGNRETCLQFEWNDDLCRCNALLARLLSRSDTPQAARRLEDARAFASRSGNVELQLRCFHAACEVQHRIGDYRQSITEGEAGILLAETCGFGKYSIDIRLSLAEAYLAAGDARQALQNARSAGDRSEQPASQYAWGRAESLHWCGILHLRLGERELARQCLIAALELRERLGQGRVEETRRALRDLEG